MIWFKKVQLTNTQCTIFRSSINHKAIQINLLVLSHVVEHIFGQWSFNKCGGHVHQKINFPSISRTSINCANAMSTSPNETRTSVLSRPLGSIIHWNLSPFAFKELSANPFSYNLFLFSSCVLSTIMSLWETRVQSSPA